ncbi:MAG TPA: FtsQ-type POTRA domain-containing protein [Thiotrichaceae bacterium]|jgi:cell division protein FtsQ|nr:FtsQ-type POTRA domain-containing protein [Thiotrichaceae bacterium]HIM07157.1 FtsQ-type POTRA domain-containing protein [Gammaproteobacteria bacterium]
MSIDMVIDQNKMQIDQADKTRSYGSSIFGALFVLVFILLLVWGGMFLSNPDTLPIKQVRVEGDFTHLSPIDLQLLVTDKVRGGFFNLDVDAVRFALLNEPWVSEVTVKRIWPDALRVIVIEQIPVVRWNDSGLLNSSGEYFSPELSTIPQELPLLSGPIGAEVNVLNRFNAMQDRLKLIGFKMESITLNERRAWTFQLSNGIKVVLGRRDFEERLNRFLTLIPTTISGRIEQTESVDMRYTNGFSIRWEK